MRTGGQILVECLEAQGVDRVFCVPGESFLAVLDALFDSPIRTVGTRHEGGAAMMADAEGKMTGRPGVAFVTRGPGATNAAAGVHIARQDSTPMVLFVGQIGRRMRGRDAFQEVDYRQTFRDLAKWVDEIDHADRIPEVISHAWHLAMSGRPGPVVLALPEDMLRETPDAAAADQVNVAAPAPSPEDIAAFGKLLTAAERPFMVLGGSRWRRGDKARVEAFSAAWGLPAGCSFRRQYLFDNLHPNYAGDVGLGINPALKKRIAESDLLLLLGARFSENPSQGFSLIDIPGPQMKLVHVHPGAEELGRIYNAALEINATPGEFLAAAAGLPARSRSTNAHDDYRAWSDTPPYGPGAVKMSAVMEHLRATLPDDAIMTNGAGNYAIWLHRFWRYRHFDGQLSPTSGSMGYGLPAAIAAKLRKPEREVICLAGDGCFQMTGQEFGTAVQEGANVVVLVVDNGIYGTIRMHQEKKYPGRISATDLRNPDFAALARAHGGHGETVEVQEDFAPALARARAAGKPALVHLKTDAEAITPAATLAGLRSGNS
ncbi:MAG: thiamine pyrophosphate-binding protein [Paracoccaceae bacterium]